MSCSVQPREGVQVEVDLGQDAVKDQVLELLFVADVVIERAGDDPQAAGQGAHGQGLGAVVGDDRQRLFDDALAGELGAAVLVLGGRQTGEGDRPSVAGSPDAARGRLLGGVLARSATLSCLLFSLLNDDLDIDHHSAYLEQCYLGK